MFVDGRGGSEGPIPTRPEIQGGGLIMVSDTYHLAQRCSGAETSAKNGTASVEQVWNMGVFAPRAEISFLILAYFLLRESISCRSMGFILRLMTRAVIYLSEK